MIVVINICFWLSAIMLASADILKQNGFAIWGMMFFFIVPVLITARVRGWV